MYYLERESMYIWPSTIWMLFKNINRYYRNVDEMD